VLRIVRIQPGGISETYFMSKPNSIVLYWAHEREDTTRTAQVVDVNKDFIGFLRVEVHKGKSISEALDAAKPAKGEIVLNSVPLK
jgi:hypothetical protein